MNYSLLGVMVDYADMAYLSGLQSGGALVVPLEGDPAFVSFGGGRELAFMRALTWLPIVPGAGKAFELLQSELEARGVAGGRIGIAGVAGIATSVAARIRDALTGFELVPFDAQLRALRAVKRPRELLAMQIAHGIVESAVGAGAAAFAAGGDNRAAMLEAERAARAHRARDVRVLASMGGPELRPWEGRLDGRHAPLRLWVAAQYQGYWAEAAVTAPAPRDDAAERAVRAMQDGGSRRRSGRRRGGGWCGRAAAGGRRLRAGVRSWRHDRPGALRRCRHRAAQPGPFGCRQRRRVARARRRSAVRVSGERDGGRWCAGRYTARRCARR